MTLKNLKVTANTLAVLLSIALVVLWMLTVTSCSVVKKATHKDVTKIDSVVSIKKDSAVVKLTDSVATKKESSEWETETVFEFDTTRTFRVPRAFREAYGIADSNLTLTDYGKMPYQDSPFSLGDKSEKLYVTYAIKSITIKEKGKKQSEETTALHKTDSAGKKSDELASKKGEHEIKDTSKKTSRVPIGLIAGGVCCFALFLIWFFWDRRVSKNNEA